MILASLSALGVIAVFIANRKLVHYDRMHLLAEPQTILYVNSI